MDLPRGKRISSEKIENIGTVYDRVPADFRGLIRLFMKYDGRLHSGDILVDDKHIIGISLDDLDKNKSVFGEEAFAEMKVRISEAKGDVDLHRFSDVEMSLALSTNERVLLRPGLPLTRFKELGGAPAPAAPAAPAAPPEPPRRRDDEDRRRKDEEARRRAEEDRKKKEDEERRRADEEARRRDEDERRKRDEESRRRADDDRKRKDEEERRRREDEEKRRRAPAPAPKKPEEPKKAEEPKRAEDEDWMKELGKLDEEWGKLEDEWKKLESIKGLSIEEGGVAKAPAVARPEELSGEDKAVLGSKPAVVKSIGFADKLRLLRFPSASNAVGMMDGKKTVGEIADALKIDKKVLADLVKELNKRGYVK
jgi:hypothetical protein